jgi:hypothetical protein
MRMNEGACSGSRGDWPVSGKAKARFRFAEDPDVGEPADAAGFLFAACVRVCGFDDVAICEVACAVWADGYCFAESFIIPEMCPMPECTVELRPVRQNNLVASGADDVEFLDGTHPYSNSRTGFSKCTVFDL